MTDLLGGQVNIVMDFMPTYVPLVIGENAAAFLNLPAKRAADQGREAERAPTL
jgi:hypothetical protein